MLYQHSRAPLNTRAGHFARQRRLLDPAHYLPPLNKYVFAPFCYLSTTPARAADIFTHAVRLSTSALRFATMDIIGEVHGDIFINILAYAAAARHRATCAMFLPVAPGCRTLL